MPPRVRVARTAAAATTAQQSSQQQQAPKNQRDPYKITSDQHTDIKKSYYSLTGGKEKLIDHDTAIKAFMQSGLTNDEAEHVFAMADRKHDDFLNLEEFAIMYQISKVRIEKNIPIPTTLPDAFLPKEQHKQYKKIAIRTTNATEANIAVAKDFLMRNGIDVSFASKFVDVIKNVILIEMNDNEFMTNANIIFHAKLQQLEYFLQQPTYKESLIRAFERQNDNWIIDILMQYDPQVYPDEWENETQRLTSSIIEKCEPNSAYKCPRCNEEKVFATQRQVRSADEGTTSFFRCCNCGYIWQEN